MLCRECGNNVADTSKFCPYCGTSLMIRMDNQEPVYEEQLFNNSYATGDCQEVHNQRKEKQQKKKEGFQFTKYMTDMDYSMSREKLHGIIVKMIIGAIIGLVFGIASEAEGVLITIFLMYMFAGAAYVWCILPFYAIGFMALTAKFIISLALGWAIAPISLIYRLVVVKLYQKEHTDSFE